MPICGTPSNAPPPHRRGPSTPTRRNPHAADHLPRPRRHTVGKRYGVEGIVAECGGCCACATCQVYVDADWQAVVGAPSSDETDMLDFAFEPRPESRLSCQIRLRPDMQGLVVRLPARQR